MDTMEKGNETARASLELMVHVSRELAAALDLRTVLRRVLFLSMQNVGAISGSIIVLDEQGQPVDSAFLLRGQVKDQNTLQLRITFEHGLAGWVARHRQAVVVPDTTQDERWLRRPDDAEERTGAKSVVSAPILGRDKLVGVMTLVHPRTGFFNEDHLTLVQAISDQAGIAILNARLYAESQRKARVMTAVAESAAVITATLNPEDVLQRILEQITQALQVEAASLALIEAETRELVFRASTDQRTPNIVGMRLKLGEGIAGWVAKEGRGVVVPDAYKDSRFQPAFDHLLGFQTRAVVCAPIRLRGKVIGVLEVLNPIGNTFEPDALLVLTGIGGLAGTAIHHAQLFERLQAAHQRYRELFEDSIDPILITDWTGRIVEANRQAAATTGIDREKLLSTSIDELHHLDREKVGTRFERLHNGGTLSYEAVLCAPAGANLPVQVYARRVLIDGVAHIQWILRDISERKKLDSLRDELTSMIYHDLRSPLGNIIASLDVLESLEQVANDENARPLLEIAMRSSERIQRLINSLLDISSLESGNPVLNRQLIEPYGLGQEALDTVRSTANSKSLDLALSIAQDLPPLWVDVDMIRRVLINLVENAIKFTPVGGRICVGARQENGFLRLWVEDTGPGIPPAEIERIFEKFARLRTNDGPRGLGMGLAFCRLAVLAHGGRIWAESEPGAGARFNLTLPVVNLAGSEPLTI